MKAHCSTLLLSLSFLIGNAQQFETVFERTNADSTATYHEVIEFYKSLESEYEEIQLITIGQTDAGYPLHLVLFDTDKKFKPKTTEKNTILINNGIHPGESDGIDASMLFLRDIVQSDELKYNYRNIVIGIIPVYNIGGSLNRNSTTRVNQNGPSEYGFRGNTNNYDLNRDFIKNDTKNAQAFTQAYHFMSPDVFIDTHVSNGADYQYTLTHLFTQHNKMGGNLGEFIHLSMQSFIERDLRAKGHLITPFVNVYNNAPENGFSQFFDSPRYSTGYTTLFNTLGLMVETHMLKPYNDRVMGTYELLFSSLAFMNTYSTTIKELRSKTVEETISKKTYPIHFKIDSTLVTPIQFKGYEAEFIKSNVTGQTRLKYDRTKPFTKQTNYFNIYKPTKEITIPNYYIVPKRLEEVVKRLKQNKVEMYPLKEDTAIEVESYTIDSFETVKSPFEGHYLHHNTVVSSSTDMQNFVAGDFLIPTNQPALKYLLETLEPEANDSFFNWNYFDVILQQKEHFSPYVFEDLAEEILANNPQLKTEFELKKQYDQDFSSSAYAQLDFIYKNSEYVEKSYMHYPIYRIIEK